MGKKILSIIICLFMLSGNIGVLAENNEISSVSIRVFNPGADITVNLSDEAGAEVSVVMLKPGTNLPDMTTDYAEFNENVAHVDSLVLDEDGKGSFKYFAEDAGIYSIYFNGASIDYSATNNDAPLTNPDRIYAEAWFAGGNYSHPDLNYRIDLTKAQLDKYGAKAVAQNLKAKLDNMPDGRKTIFLTNDLMPRTLCGERIWWDEGVVKTKAILDEFFKELSDIGGMVDFLNSDTEQTFSMYALTKYANTNDAAMKEKFYEIIAEISSDPRYPEFEEKLVARGYDTASDKGVPLSSICTYGNKYYNYLKFNAVCGEYASAYLDDAIYQTAKKYFANVKCTDYGTGDGKLWMGGYSLQGIHPNYVGGNSKGMGTHASPILYSKQLQDFAYQEIIGVPGEDGSSERKVTISYEGASNDFKEMQAAVFKLRGSALVNEGQIMPWIATEPIQSDSFDDVRYRNEMLMHIAIHNPDRLLYFNANTNAEESAKQTEELMVILDEVNSLVAYGDRRSLNTDRPNLEIPLTMSGIYANGRNIWRITPDNAIVTSDAFLVSGEGEEPVFSAGGVTVTFPQGSIINVENTNSDIGYWVETPENITPVMVYDDSLKAFEEKAVISFYDELGQKADPAVDEVIDVVAAYQGMYNGKMNFIAAKYDENGMLIDVEAKECGVFSPNGNAMFLGMTKELDTAAIRFFLWENGTIRPIATEEM